MHNIFVNILIRIMVFPDAVKVKCVKEILKFTIFFVLYFKPNCIECITKITNVTMKEVFQLY